MMFAAGRVWGDGWGLVLCGRWRLGGWRVWVARGLAAGGGFGGCRGRRGCAQADGRRSVDGGGFGGGGWGGWGRLAGSGWARRWGGRAAGVPASAGPVVAGWVIRVCGWGVGGGRSWDSRWGWRRVRSGVRAKISQMRVKLVERWSLGWAVRVCSMVVVRVWGISAWVGAVRARLATASWRTKRSASE